MQRGTILNVDDNAIVRFHRNRTLAHAGFTVLDAACGTDAISMAENLHPDVILLDVNLPDIHGFDVRRRLRSNPATANIKVVHITAGIPEEEKYEALAEGADAFLVDPTTPSDLVEAVSSVLSVQRK